MKSEGRTVEHFTGSDIVTKSPSIFPEAARSIVSTDWISGGSESTTTEGLTRPVERFPRRSRANIRNVTSASINGTFHSNSPSLASFSAIWCQIPAPVAYSMEIPEDWSPPEMASVIFEGFHSRVLVVEPFQNSPDEGAIQASDAIAGPWESLKIVAPVRVSLLNLYALSIQRTVTR